MLYNHRSLLYIVKIKKSRLIQQDLFGLVLSGGRSTRMGVDKGSIHYHNQSQREYVFKLLSAVCSRVYTSCNQDQLMDSSLNPLTDAYDVDGPMNGILSAFQKHTDKAWFVVAIDLPNVTLDVIMKLAGQRNRKSLATCYNNPDAGAPEPLLTIWEPDAFPMLLANVQSGKISPRFFLENNNVHRIEPTDLHIFLNINNASDRDRWLKPD